MLAGSGGWPQALELAKASNADQAVIRYIEKAAVSGSGLSDPLATNTQITAWIESLALYCAATQIPFVPMPLNTHVAISTVNASAYLRNIGASIPLSRLTLANTRLTPINISLLLILTAKLARFAGPAGEALINLEERKGVGLVIDATVFDVIVDGSTPLRISDGLDPAADLAALLAYINSTGASRPYYVMDPATANDLSLFKGVMGSPFLFPNMTPRGGTLQGVPALVSGGLVGRQIIGLDASSIAFNVDNIIVDTSSQATIEMNDAPVGNSLIPTSTNLTSMFQTNSLASRINVALGIERLRDTAVAVVTDTTYGSPQT